MLRKKIIIANWKMRLDHKKSVALATRLRKRFRGFKKNEIVVCPSFTSLRDVGRIISRSSLKLGAQDIFYASEGAYTGEVSGRDLEAAGCRYAIIGHSERRMYLNESDELINKKIKFSLTAGKIIPIVCVGESLAEKNAGKTYQILNTQLKKAFAGVVLPRARKVIIAYEPIWAIGTGEALEAFDVEKAHAAIRLALTEIFGPAREKDNFSIIYGGSVTRKEAADFAGINNIDGLLVGGASLKADEFFKIATGI